MSKKIKDQYLSSRLIYRLAEASTLYDYSVEELLDYGSAGKLHFCTPMPNDLSLFLIHDMLIEVESHPIGSLKRKMIFDRIVGDKPVQMDGIAMLVLSKDDCTNIKLRGEIEQSIYHSAHKFNEDSLPSFNRPQVTTKESKFNLIEVLATFNTVFATYPKTYNGWVSNAKIESRKAIAVNISNLFVASLSLEKLFCVNNDPVKKITTQETWTNDSGTSSKLFCLITKANDYGKFATSEMSEVELKKLDDRVKKSLANNDFKNEKILEEAMYIIRPEFARKYYSIYQKRAEQELQIPTINDLKEAAKKWWSKYIARDKHSYAKTSDVESYLRDEKKFGAGCSQAIARIIRPDNLKMGRPPRD